MATQTTTKTQSRPPRPMVAFALIAALGAAAALGWARPWEGAGPAADEARTTQWEAAEHGRLAEIVRLEILQHEALTEAVFGPIPWGAISAQSLADALAQHEALTDAVFSTAPAEVPPPEDLSAYPHLAEFVAKYHPWTDGWRAPTN